MPDLRAEWNVELDTFYVKRKIQPVVWRATPQPGNYAQGLESQLFHCAFQFAHRFDGLFQIDCRDASESVRVTADHLCHVIVVVNPLPRTMPRRKHQLLNARTVHAFNTLLCGQARFYYAARA